MIPFRRNSRTISGLATVLLVASLTAPASAQNRQVKIGAIGPMSGGSSTWGQSVAEGTKFAPAE